MSIRYVNKGAIANSITILQYMNWANFGYSNNSNATIYTL